MSSLQNREMGLCLLVCIISCSFIYVSSQSAVAGNDNSSVSEGTVFIDGKTSIGKIDEDFICATLDWWPPEKCDYGTCSWDQASLINLVMIHFSLLFCFWSCFRYLIMMFYNWNCAWNACPFLSCTSPNFTGIILLRMSS